MKFIKALLIAVPLTTFVCTPTFGEDSSLETNVYDFVDDYGNYNLTQTTDASSSLTSLTIDGVEIKVGLTAWSDTGIIDPSYYYGNGDFYWDDSVVKSANIGQWNGGLTIENRDRTYNSYNQGDHHSIDNFSEYGKQDFDMLLLSFDHAVTLTGATVSWMHSDNGSKEITVAGLSDNASSMFGGHNTWSDIAGAAIAGATGHYGISGYQSSFDKLTSAKYWLVGAYNTFFDDNAAASYNGVGFKLSSLTVGLEKSPPPNTQVSEPGALALMSLGLGLVLYRRKRRV
jgi:hypothetical protein